MKPAPFEYFAPTSLGEALALLHQHGDEAKLLAGGQSLIPVMNFRLSQPAVLIDINGVFELSGIMTTDAQGLRIKAMSRHVEVEKSTLIAQHAPLISETMPYIAHPQIRNRGTIGGSIAHADPAGELPVICVALNAQFLLKREGNERWVSADDFFIGLFETALEPEEIICEIQLPPMPANSGYGFQELARRHGDYAQAGAAAFVQLDASGNCVDAKLVFLNVGERPMMAHEGAKQLMGQMLGDEVVDTAVNMATQNEIDPTTDIHATANYKRHLAGVLAKRALNQAHQRAIERSQA